MSTVISHHSEILAITSELMFEDNVVFDKFMENRYNKNQSMEYELVGATLEGEEMENRNESIESEPLEGELVKYKPVGTSQ
ncbi:30540_t:CDS:2, partial [Gigaspora margarita]